MTTLARAEVLDFVYSPLMTQMKSVAWNENILWERASATTTAAVNKSTVKFAAPARGVEHAAMLVEPSGGVTAPGRSLTNYAVK